MLIAAPLFISPDWSGKPGAWVGMSAEKRGLVAESLTAVRQAGRVLVNSSRQLLQYYLNN